MTMRSNFCALGVAVLAAGLLGVAPSPSPAVAATLKARHESGVTGHVTLRPVGKSTLVELKLDNGLSVPYNFSLHSGKDCTDSRYVGPIVPLNPTGTGQVSRTLVAMPIEKIRSANYVVDARNATARKQFAMACARL